MPNTLLDFVFYIQMPSHLRFFLFKEYSEEAKYLFYLGEHSLHVNALVIFDKR